MVPARNKRLFVPQADSSGLENHAPGSHELQVPEVLNDLNSIHEYDRFNGFLSAADPKGAVSDAKRSFYDLEEAQDQVFSPPLLMDSSLLTDAYEDLLGMLSRFSRLIY